MKRIALILIATACLGIGGFYLAMVSLLSPVRGVVGKMAGGAEVIALDVRDLGKMQGWLYTPPKPKGAVLLAHGIRANAMSMIGRREFLEDAGYAVFAIDLPAHGQSDGDAITLGRREAWGVAAGVKFLQERFDGRPIFVIGSSLGAASAVLADYGANPPDGVVLEAAFGSLEQAVKNRLSIRVGDWATGFSSLITMPLEWYIGAESGEISPMERISDLGAPALLIVGERDRRALPESSEAMLERAEPGSLLWIVEGAGHLDLRRMAGEEYDRRVLNFIEELTYE